ncbi:MAG: hypothetical protein ACR2HF_07325 [Methylococcaceae bacterium]
MCGHYRSDDRNVVVCVRELVYTEFAKKRVLDIYHRNSTHSKWHYSDSIIHPERDRSNSFGNAVALSEDGGVILISDATPHSAGTVYEYTAWDHRWEPSGFYRQKVHGYGHAVALSPDATQVIIGAQSIEGPGVVYCYHRGGLLLQELRQQRIPTCLDSFGAALVYDSVSHLLIVGAPRSEPLQYFEKAPYQGFGHVHFYECIEDQWVYSEDPRHRWFGRTGYGIDLYLTSSRHDVAKETLCVQDGNRIMRYNPDDWRLPPSTTTSDLDKTHASTDSTRIS